MKKLINISNFRIHIISMLMDTILIFLSILFSFSLRLGFNPIEVFEKDPFFEQSYIFFIITSHLIIFIFLGVYKIVWRFISTHDLTRLILAITISIPVSALVLFFVYRLEYVPRTIFIIHWLLSIILLGGVRFSYRLFKDQGSHIGDKKVILIGAGAAGEQLFREFRSNKNLNTYVVGFIDDKKELRKKKLHGIKIFGGIDELTNAVSITGAVEAIISFANPNAEQIKKIITACSDADILLKKIPNIGSIINGEIRVNQIKEISPEDLLGRSSVTLDKKSIFTLINNKVILVTGAGGSIGSELCRQIALLNPKLIVFFEAVELFLYNLEYEFKAKYPDVKFKSVIGDVKSYTRVNNIIKKHQPNIIFHAAAYKHVPLMEENPVEPILNNVLGTSNIVKSAIEHQVERFVLISTDKAVNPTNVMGATKRLCEMIVQYEFNHQQTKEKYADVSLVNEKDIVNKTKVISVRFGNVLGSSGSVIPLFKEQIEKGGPVTVTHPDINRYFMSIPEACQLVMQAGALGSGGEVFVLDMGEPIKIVDLAREMIILAGYEPDRDIKIEFTGLRPGEKLYEELLTDSEKTEEAFIVGTKIAKLEKISQNQKDKIELLISDCLMLSKNEIKIKIKEIIPEYQPQS